jgi:hypothetical protein
MLVGQQNMANIISVINWGSMLMFVVRSSEQFASFKISFTILGTSKNLALLVFRVPNFIFWLKEGGGINKLHVVFRNPLPSDFLPIGVFRSALNVVEMKTAPVLDAVFD